ncbi:hypothetical protein Rhopal_007846-T1 [Rhodotorula paludigena]|uniref:Uncharacterized protein n=1 Tax=Rhodotorula paludigena TaxID=86838 RepID=A0AAV5GXR9_9BASI|nr:hypothetical protein Rhopal_007846-T1 [Rhodotorula paludigena]
MRKRRQTSVLCIVESYFIAVFGTLVDKGRCNVNLVNAQTIKRLLPVLKTSSIPEVASDWQGIHNAADIPLSVHMLGAILRETQRQRLICNLVANLEIPPTFWQQGSNPDLLLPAGAASRQSATCSSCQALSTLQELGAREDAVLQD